MAKKKKVYAVFKGKGGFTGIVDSWARCQGLTSGVRGGCRFKSFAKQEEARAYLSQCGSGSISIRGTALQPASCSVGSRGRGRVRRANEAFGTQSGSLVDASNEGRRVRRRRRLLEHDEAVKEDSSAHEAGPNRAKVHVVYTDGACTNNQDAATRRAGWGAYFGADDPRNLSEPLLGLPQTNNRAEMTAVLPDWRDYEGRPDSDE